MTRSANRVKTYRKSRRPLWIVCAKLCLAATLFPLCGLYAPPAAAQSRCILFVTAGGPLSQVLRSYARQAGIQVIFDERTASKERVAPTRSHGCPDAQLRLILAGTGLSYRRIGNDLYVISNAAPREPERREQIEPPVEEIIVTARRRPEQAVNVPISLTQVSGATLEERPVSNVADFLQEAPGVGIYDQGNGFSRIMIRGVSTTLGANENGYYLDDLPFTGVTVPISPDVRAWDLDRVEVLRGPQGTLFGEGSLGGTVRILTTGANLDEWQAKAGLFLSTTDDGGANGGAKAALNLPVLPGKFAVRVSGTHERYGGWVDDALAGKSNLNEQHYDSLRVKARFDPTDRLSLTGSFWLYNSAFSGGDSFATDDGQVSQSLFFPSRLRYQLYGIAARHDLAFSQIFYGYSHNYFTVPRQGMFRGAPLQSDIHIKVDAHEVRIASKSNAPLQWTIGGYFRSADRNDYFKYAPLGYDTIDFTSSRTHALFGEVTYALDGFDLTAGLRYFAEKLRGYENNEGVLAVDAGGTYTSLNPRLSLAWHPVTKSTLYVSAAKGFRGGQLQPTSSLNLASELGIELPPSLSQDSIWTYEFGGKADLLDRLLNVEFAFYYSRWKNVAVRVPIKTTGFNGALNSPGTDTRGAELALKLRPARGLLLSTSASYVDARYRGAVPDTAIVRGSPVEEVAKFTANASADYRVEIASGTFATARIGWQHTSPRHFKSFPGYLPGDAIDRVDARIGVDFGRFGIAFFAENLLNEGGAITYRTVQEIAPGVDDVYSYRLRPRTVGIDLTFRYPR